MSSFSLTSSQLKAIEAFKKFLEGPEQVFLLKGAAGTGKTTLVSEFLKILIEQERKTHLMAPTGRAAFIIGSKTGRGASTIHRFIYGLNKLKSNNLSQDEEEDGTLHLRFELYDNSKAATNEVYIVDEASMVSDIYSENEAFSFGSGKLLTDLFKFIDGRKILFVGDYAQLPPIGMLLSPALSKEYIEEKFQCGVAEFMLKEIVRQDSDSFMLVNANSIRDGIESKTFNEFRLKEGNDSIKELAGLLDSYFQLSEKEPSPRASIVVYTNYQALEYNTNIRLHYFGENAQRVVPGELLMIARNNYNHDVELFNGNIVKVISAQSDDEIETKNIRIKLGKGRTVVVPLQFRDVVIRFKQRGSTVELAVKILDNFLNDPNGNITAILSRALIVDFEQRLPQDIRSKLYQIRNYLRGKAVTETNIKQLADAYTEILFKDKYYNALICKYGYAMTCHKAQGGEWENVFVDLFRYGGNSNEDYFRWAYTALTRASKKIYFFRPPDFDYISNLVADPIQVSTNIKVSVYSKTGDFLTERFERIQRVAEKYGLEVIEDRSRPYQHWVTFIDSDKNSVTFNLWYNKEGYSGKEEMRTSSSSQLTEKVTCVLEDSYAPENINIAIPDRPFAQKLINHVKTILEEHEIMLLNITQEQYQDVFHLKTRGFAKIGFHYNSKGRYTHMSLQSTLGQDDYKLKELREAFL